MSQIFLNILNTITPWLYDHGIKIAAIITVAYAIRKFAVIFIEKVVRKVVVSDNFLSREAEKKREDTLIRIFTVSLVIVVWLLALLMILDEAGIALVRFWPRPALPGSRLALAANILFAISSADFLLLWKTNIALETWCVLTKPADW